MQPNIGTALETGGGRSIELDEGKRSTRWRRLRPPKGLVWWLGLSIVVVGFGVLVTFLPVSTSCGYKECFFSPKESQDLTGAAVGLAGLASALLAVLTMGIQLVHKLGGPKLVAAVAGAVLLLATVMVTVLALLQG